MSTLPVLSVTSEDAPALPSIWDNTYFQLHNDPQFTNLLQLLSEHAFIHFPPNQDVFCYNQNLSREWKQNESWLLSQGKRTICLLTSLYWINNVCFVFCPLFSTGRLGCHLTFFTLNIKNTVEPQPPKQFSVLTTSGQSLHQAMQAYQKWWI